MRLYQCEDNLEGIFTAIYNAYADKADPCNVRIDLTGEPLLFAESVPVVCDVEKAAKVSNTLRRRFGEEDFFHLCLALASEDEEKAQAVYRTVVHGLGTKCRPGHLYDHLADPDIHKAFALGRNAGNEYMHMRGFLRFDEVAQGILYARMSPLNHLLTFLMPHFADRLPMEHFCIHDVRRRLYGVHPAGRDWFVVHENDLNVSGEENKELVGTGTEKAFLAKNMLDPENSLGRRSEHANTEVDYAALFRFFCEKVGIEERRNLELQRNMLPYRFREHMTEFR